MWGVDLDIIDFRGLQPENAVPGRQKPGRAGAPWGNSNQAKAIKLK